MASGFPSAARAPHDTVRICPPLFPGVPFFCQQCRAEPCSRLHPDPQRSGPAARLHAIHNPALFQLFEPLPELSPSAGLSAGKERICRMAVTVVLAVFTARPAAVDFIQRIPAVVGDACRRFMAMDGYL